MDGINTASESLRLSEHYRQMSDGELLNLAQDDSELTDPARAALANEISQRRLRPEAEEPVPTSQSGKEADSSYEDERQLVHLIYVWSAADALQVQTFLERVGVPFFIGPEKAKSVDAVTSSFAEGLSVQVMRAGVPLASAGLQYYAPVNDPLHDEEEKGGIVDIGVRCPKCKSEEVIFDNLVSETTNTTDEFSAKFRWTCDSCGFEWTDDGVAKES